MDTRIKLFQRQSKTHVIDRKVRRHCRHACQQQQPEYDNPKNSLVWLPVHGLAAKSTTSRNARFCFLCSTTLSRFEACGTCDIDRLLRDSLTAKHLPFPVEEWVDAEPL